MTRLKLFLKNSAKRALLFSLLLIYALALSGCTSSTLPTYPKESIPQAIEDICKKEYGFEIKARIIKSTLWIYLPIPEGTIETADKPQKSIERFLVEENNVDLNDSLLLAKYLIKPIPEEEKFQEMKYKKEVFEKISNIWKALRRVLFSMEEPEKNSPKFFVIIIADTIHGFIIKDILYYLDFKKVSYGLISWEEYQHRIIQEVELAPQVTGDLSGDSIEYRNISLQEFILKQIQHRIKFKFQKPEAEKDADTDKEVLKIIRYTLNIYGFKDFSSLILENLLTGKKIIFNQAAALSAVSD